MIPALPVVAQRKEKSLMDIYDDGSDSCYRISYTKDPANRDLTLPFVQGNENQ